MKLISRVTVFGLLLALPLSSMAWGLIGHRVVGEIAWGYMTPQAKKTVQQILGDESLAMATNWADFIKSDPSYRYLGNWHYINFKSGISEKDMRNYLRSDTATDAYTRMNFLVKELKNKTLPADKKLFYLRMLIHIAGDLQQPMHTARPDDQGGNAIKIDWFGKATNLHSMWDEQLIEFQQLSYTEYAKVINHPTAADKTKWQKESIADWIVDSYRITESLYKEIESAPGNKLSYRYNFDHLKTLDNQLLKGGVRLGALLNQLFG
ncbi:S1/P1 nuclease [Sediminibacterium soli]|uniref:S1/P1 nuclease n=1 Tax=Sediminibacterium soli TaxID=2698829 RepID=UPI00137A5CAB|nr:S1/P1 nuclease [Sediminibacterium soli]NCI45652.1 S1/P1 nuclease [Sediminibacterium soli]